MLNKQWVAGLKELQKTSAGNEFHQALLQIFEKQAHESKESWLIRVSCITGLPHKTLHYLCYDDRGAVKPYVLDSIQRAVSGHIQQLQGENRNEAFGQLLRTLGLIKGEHTQVYLRTL